MAQFCARWELVSMDDNFDKYMEAVGVGEENRKLASVVLASGSKVVQDISRDGTTWTVKVVTPKGEKVDVYPEGTPTEVTTLDGRAVTVIYTLEGDELVESQEGSGFKSRNVRRVEGDTMVMTFASDSGITSSRSYKRL